MLGLFARLQLGSKQDDGRAGLDAEFFAQCSGVCRRGDGLRGEAFVVHRVRRGKLRHVRTEAVCPVLPVAVSNGKSGGDGVAKSAKEEMFCGQLPARAWPVAKPGLGTQEHRDAEHVGRGDAEQSVGARVAVYPQRIEGRAAVGPLQRSQNAAANRAQGRDGAVVTQGLEKLRAVTFEQRRVPGDLDAEALVAVGANGKIRAEEDGEIDVGLARDAAQ